MNTEQEKQYVALMSAVNPRDKHGDILMPSEEQKSVIVCDKPVISVIAGAGSGKTRTMTNRIAYCLGTGKVQPAQVLGLTFTNKAAGELDERVSQCLWQLQRRGFFAEAEGQEEASSLLLERPTISTYNSFASEIVAHYGMLVSCDSSTRLITDGERYQLMSQVVDSMTPEEAAVFDSQRSTIIANALAMSAALLDHGTSIDTARSFFTESSEILADIMQAAPDTVRGLGWDKGLSEYWNKLKSNAPSRLKEGLESLRLVEKYWELKRERGVIEFADQVDIAVQILTKYEWVRQEISSRYRLVLLDEYQDTSMQQAEMLRLALGKHDSSQWHSLCAVGDPNQAIYGFRGASANAFSHFSQMFASQEVCNFSLSTTYRNDIAILEAANAVAEGIKTDGGYCNRLQPRDKAGAGRVIQIRPLRREDSYRAIAAHIRDKIAQVRDREEKAKREDPRYQVRGAEIAVLCLKRRYFDDIAKELEKLNIPYEIVGGTAILERPEILTLRNALIGATYPYRHDVFTRLFAYLNIGVADLRALSAFVRRQEKKAQETNSSLTPTMSDIIGHLSAENAPGISEEAKRRLTWLAKVLAQIRERSNLPLADIIHGAIKDLGLELAAVSRVENSQHVQSALDSFVRMAGQYQAEHAGSHLPDFLDWLDYVEEYERAGEEESGVDKTIALGDVEVSPGIVQIMTIHSAKGLEWKDLVVIPEMVESEFSDVTSGIDKWQTQKEVFPYPLRSDKNYLPSFAFRQPRPEDYPPSEEGEKAPTITNSPHYPLARSFQAFTEEELNYESQEARRLAYVAFTRAAEELVLAGYGTKNSELVEQKGGRGKDKADLVISLIAPSRFLCDIEKKNDDKAIMCDIADISFESWAQEYGEEKSATLCQIFSVTETEKEKISQLTDETNENYQKYRSLFSQRDWLTLEKSLSETISVDPIVNTEAHNSYPFGLARSLGSIDSYDEQSAQCELDMLEEQADLLLKELEEEGQSLEAARAYLTASDIVRMAGTPDNFLNDQRRPIPREPSTKARIGTQVHQRIADSYVIAPIIDLDMPEEISPHKETIDAHFRAFQQSSWARFPKLHIEAPVSFVLADKVVRCTIDAVLDTSTNPNLPPITIVDWKTGAVPSEEEMQSRQLQLAVYRLAASKAWGYALDDIGAVFVHLKKDGTVQEVEAGHMSEEEIIECISSALPL